LLARAPPRQEQQAKAGARRIEEAFFAGMPEQESAKPEEEADATLTVSDRERLQRKDFAQMTAAEIAAAKDAIKRLVLSLDEVKTRRLAPHRHGHILDNRPPLPARLPARRGGVRPQQ